VASGALVDGALAILVIGLALWITAARTAYGAVVGFVAYGLLLALIWVRLAAVDVALTEAALGTGLTGLLLLGAAARLSPYESAEAASRPGLGLRILVGFLCASVAIGLAAVVLLLPEPAPTLAPLVAENLPPTGVANPVTGVLMAHRAIDTLLETVVLLPALIGVWSLASDGGWQGRPGSLPRSAGSGPLTLLAQVLPPFGILVGVHLVWIGADAPGGKFQGAAILAAMWILILVAGLREPPRVTGRLVRWLLILGPLVFIGIGVAGIPLAAAFLAFPEGHAKPLILAIEAALTLSVALVLGLLLAGPPVAEDRGAGRQR
jgi:multisubunit Na+/H+ antiporter MnhB subunit